MSVYSKIKVARPSLFVGTPSIFESLRLKQIYPKFSMDTKFGGFVKH